ncbi:unnamed protein product [Dibothriocephalus latus]|uniref:Uncharacterized protein n=1 Tax=Dibothriocephalus latus TaxID=60516 RepID=A0A3P7MNU8_DIBLA|nr:unnamed protein product [Dibothriocephalus latus]
MAMKAHQCPARYLSVYDSRDFPKGDDSDDEEESDSRSIISSLSEDHA